MFPLHWVFTDSWYHRAGQREWMFNLRSSHWRRETTDAFKKERRKEKKINRKRKEKKTKTGEHFVSDSLAGNQGRTQSCQIHTSAVRRSEVRSTTPAPCPSSPKESRTNSSIYLQLYLSSSSPLMYLLWLGGGTGGRDSEPPPPSYTHTHDTSILAGGQASPCSAGGEALTSGGLALGAQRGLEGWGGASHPPSNPLPPIPAVVLGYTSMAKRCTCFHVRIRVQFCVKATICVIVEVHDHRVLVRNQNKKKI